MVRKNKCRGVSSIEFLVSFSVVVTVMTFATSMMFNISGVWRDIEHQRLAVCELSNQLEVLTRFTGDALIEKIKRIEPSEFCKQGLDEPTIKAVLVADQLGQRIDLELVWQHLPVDKKVRLSGWSIGSVDSADSFKQTPEPSEEGKQP